MAEYIDRDVLLEKLNQEACDCEFMRLLSDIPAADVEPVVHGRWVAKPQMYRHPNARNYYCSECRYEPTETKKFCPLCGARMDGDDG